MPRLRFTPAKAQAQAPTVSPGKQAQAAAAPNVMQWLQYEIGPAEALSRFGQTVGKSAELMFDAYIDDLDRKDREQRQEEADIIDALAGQIKRFAKEQRELSFKDISDRGISSEKFSKDFKAKINEQIKSLKNSSLVTAYLQDNPGRKNRLLRRLDIDLGNAALSDTFVTISAKQTTEQQQQLTVYEETLKTAKLDFAEQANEKGLVYKEDYTPDTSRTEIGESLDAISAEISNRYKQDLPEEYHQRLDNDLRSLFISSSGRLQTWAVHLTLSENGKTKSRIINLAKREARLQLAEKLNENRIQQRLVSANVDDANEANESIFLQIDSIANGILADKRFAGKLDDLDGQEIKTSLRELFQQGDYATRSEAVTRFLQGQEEVKTKQEKLKLRDERTRLGQAEIDFSDGTKGIIQEYNAGNIDLEEAESRIEAAAESARQKNQLEIAPDATELSAEDIQFNKELKQRTDTLRTSLQTRLSGVEGTREKQLSVETKAELDRMKDKRQIDSISRASTKYRERLIEFNQEMLNNRGNHSYTLEFIQEKQLEILAL